MPAIAGFALPTGLRWKATVSGRIIGRTALWLEKLGRESTSRKVCCLLSLLSHGLQRRVMYLGGAVPPATRRWRRQAWGATVSFLNPPVLRPAIAVPTDSAVACMDSLDHACFRAGLFRRHGIVVHLPPRPIRMATVERMAHGIEPRVAAACPPPGLERRRRQGWNEPTMNPLSGREPRDCDSMRRKVPRRRPPLIPRGAPPSAAPTCWTIDLQRTIRGKASRHSAGVPCSMPDWRLD